MTDTLINLLLVALATCNTHATRVRPNLTALTIATGYVNAGTAWQPGFEQCATVAPIAAQRLRAYFAEQERLKAEKQLRDDQAAVAKAAAALAESP